MSDDLEERLRKHAKAFEGLMSLIPANQYYAKDNSDQHKKKKQSSAERKAAKKAKYDPDTQKSATDVLHENERKRKREAGFDDGDNDEGSDGRATELPLSALATRQKAKKKKQRINSEGDSAAEIAERGLPATATAQERKAEKRRQKLQRKKTRVAEQNAKAQAKVERRKARQQAANEDELEQTTIKPEAVEVGEEESDDASEAGDLRGADFSGLTASNAQSASSSEDSSVRDSPVSEASAKPSAASSISSIIPPAVPPKPTTQNIGASAEHVSHEDLQARLQARIAEFRAARKADGTEGRPPRNRSELLEARRKKEEQRKAQKKEQRKQAREDEIRQKAEAELALLRGSGSPLSIPDIFSPRSPQTNNFSFGRVAFADGQQMDAQLSGLSAVHKKKGPQDIKGALQAAQHKEARLGGFDEEKRADIEEKDLWLNAKKRAHGERVSDNTSLLKKALKSKQKAKLKSEKEWNDRIKGVQTGKEMRQKKREDNLRKRRDEKGGKGKKKGVKVRSRPGFEGSFKSRPRPKPKK